MFDFKSPRRVVVDLPFKLYWAIAGSITLLLLIGQLFLSLPEWTINTIDALMPCLKASRLYTEAERRKKEKDELSKAKASVKPPPQRRGTDGSESSGKTQKNEAQASNKKTTIEARKEVQEVQEREMGQQRNGLVPFWRRRSPPSPKGDGKV